MSALQVYIVDDEEHLRLAAAQTFELADIPCQTFQDGHAALENLTREFAGIIVTDLKMPKMDGRALLSKVMEIDHEIPVILVTGFGDVELAVSSLQQGAYDFIEKPIKPDRLIACAKRALEQRRLVLENRELRTQSVPTDIARHHLTGRSEAIETLRKNISTIAPTKVDVLISGDTGTGKEVVARLLHQMSDRASGPFVHINCAALPKDMIESELFGHEVGAFPGAMRARFGKFEYAKGGTICLDEVDSLSMDLQAKLLHALQNRTITRLGTNEPVQLDVRVVAISKSNLAKQVDKAKFRQDLFYLLNVANIQVPNVSARRQDIPSLFARLVQESATKFNADTPEISQSILQMIAAREWPGNVREMRNVAERLVLGLDLDLGSEPQNRALTLAEIVAAHEKAAIAAAISANNGQLKPTYESLGLSRKTLYEKMKRHGLLKSDGAETP